MKKTTVFILALSLISLTILSFTATSIWSYDKSHQKVAFNLSHLLVSDVEGYFKEVDATITSNGPTFENAVAEMTIQAASINTDDDKRDAHLRSDDFFAVDKYPTITFKSTSFKKGKTANQYIINGNLTMHGVTKSVQLTGTCKTTVNPFNKKDIAGFKLTGKINRYDFGVGQSTPEAIVGNAVSIVINAEFIKN